jgi:hypothetical protein
MVLKSRVSNESNSTKIRGKITKIRGKIRGKITWENPRVLHFPTQHSYTDPHVDSLWIGRPKMGGTQSRSWLFLRTWTAKKCVPICLFLSRCTHTLGILWYKYNVFHQRKEGLLITLHLGCIVVCIKKTGSIRDTRC